MRSALEICHRECHSSRLIFGQSIHFPPLKPCYGILFFGSTNLSGLRKFIVILSFGTNAYKPNDEVREARIRSCKETFKEPKDVKETPAEKSERKDRLLLCRYASLGHPNEMGALIYTEAIKGHLQWMIDKAGWKREKKSEPLP
jgi:hypothetical protein